MLGHVQYVALHTQSTIHAFWPYNMKFPNMTKISHGVHLSQTRSGSEEQEAKKHTNNQYKYVSSPIPPRFLPVSLALILLRP